jgi:hypothetical protein
LQRYVWAALTSLAKARITQASAAGHFRALAAVAPAQIATICRIGRCHQAMLPVNRENHYIEIWTGVPSDFAGNTPRFGGRASLELDHTKKFVRLWVLRKRVSGLLAGSYGQVGALLCIGRSPR